MIEIINDEKETEMDFFKNILKGLIIGIGAVAPGVSGGTFAVILGIYDKLTDAIANFYKNFKKKMIFLIPLGIGVVIGILGFSKIMKYLFEFHEAQVKFLFIGLMVGTLPSVFREANKKGFKSIYIVPCVVTFSMTVFAMMIESTAVILSQGEAPNTMIRGLYGVIIGIGTIVPGISSSFMLMYVGGYEYLLDGIVNFDIPFMIPVVMGFGLSILLFAKIISILFKKLYGYTYYSILGFVIGSILTILPPVTVGSELVVGLALCAVGFVASFRLNKLML